MASPVSTRDRSDRKNFFCSPTSPCETCVGAGYKVPVPKAPKVPVPKAPKKAKKAKKAKDDELTAVAKMIAEAVRKCPREQREQIIEGLARLQGVKESSSSEDEDSEDEDYVDSPRSPSPSPSPSYFRSDLASALDSALPDGPDLPEDADYDTEGLCHVAPGETHATLDAQLAAYHDKITLRAFYRLPGSTVVATKDGLLELRRGDETWVRFKESRGTWSSFAEWRAAIGDFTNPIAISAT